MSYEEALNLSKNEWARKDFINGSTIFVNKNLECYYKKFHLSIPNKITFEPKFKDIINWKPCVV